ncbi:MAG: hypothetical protein H6Q75_747 [Firmicutes bacterium]|nr:hypothetical protein [Bacillota bacterium]
MADFKRQMCKHLRSAKVWLAQAEESFDKDSDIRGELNLFLAQAELQHARERNLSKHGKYKYPVLRHVISLALAMTLVFGGYGAYWLSIRQPETPASPPLAALEPQPVQVSKVAQAEVLVANPSPPKVPEPPVGTEITTSVPIAVPAQPMVEVKPQPVVVPVQQEKLLSQAEMEKVIRAAEKSLRGQ